MFAFVALALGSEDHTAFDGAIQFDALQATIPAIPGTPPTATVATTTINVCLATCDATYTAAIQAAVRATLPANSQASVVVTCGGTCTSGTARSLLQTGTSANIVITGATTAELNVLANNIIAGNLVNVGIAPTTVVTGATVTPTTVTPAQAVTNLGGAAVLPPANPASPTGAAICGNSAFQRLLCLPGINAVQTALQRCAAAQTTIAVNLALQGIGSAAAPGAICCGCNVARRSLQQTTGAQVTATATTTTVAQLCAAAPRGYPGCGKRGSKKGLLGLLGLLGLIPLILCLLICCLCCLRRKRRGQAMLFSQTAVPAPIPAPLPVVHEVPHVHAGPDFHVHP